MLMSQNNEKSALLNTHLYSLIQLKVINDGKVFNDCTFIESFLTRVKLY